MTGALEAGSSSHRPLRWIVLGAVVGGIAVGAIYLLEVFADPHAFTSSSTAPIGLLFLPFATAWYAVPGALGGAALGYLFSGFGSGHRLREPRMAAAALVALALGSWGAVTLVRAVVLGAEVRWVEQLSEPQLREVLESRIFGRNLFVLGAVAGNPQASGETLDRIARSTDPELHHRMGTVFHEVMGKNPKGLAVMRLVALNPNVRPDTLERLAASPDAYVRGDVAGNPKLPGATLERLAASDEYLVRWGVSRNPRTSPAALARLSRSEDPYTRRRVASNPGTPAEVRGRLLSDPDEMVRAAALQRAPATPDPGPPPVPFRQ